MTFIEYVKQVATEQGSLLDLVPAQAEPSTYYYTVNGESYLSKIHEGVVREDGTEIDITEFHDIWSTEEGYINETVDRSEFPAEFHVSSDNCHAYKVPNNIVDTIKHHFPELLL